MNLTAGQLREHNMVSIPTPNLNGGLKPATSTVIGGGNPALANAPRVFLASSSNLIASNRNGSLATTALPVVNVSGGGGGVSGGVASVNNIGGTNNNNNNNNNNTTAVRHFSQFSKVQTLDTSQPSNASIIQVMTANQRRIINSDNMILVNGTRQQFIFTSTSKSPALAATTTTSESTINTTTTSNTTSTTSSSLSLSSALSVPNGGNKTKQELETVIKMDKLGATTSKLATPPTTSAATPAATSAATATATVAVTSTKDLEYGEPKATAAAAAAVARAHHHHHHRGDYKIDGEDSNSCNEEIEPELDIVINNVVCSFSVRCHLNLREIAIYGQNVEYRREHGMVTMKLRRPYTTASIWSSGRITCTGATSEIQAKIAARRYARVISKLGFPVKFQNFRVVNVLGTCSMPWAIKITNFSEFHRGKASYEPELHPGVTYKMLEPKATLKIFSTGSITVTAPTVNDVETAIQQIFPLVHQFRKKRSREELMQLRQKLRKSGDYDPKWFTDLQDDDDDDNDNDDDGGGGGGGSDNENNTKAKGSKTLDLRKPNKRRRSTTRRSKSPSLSNGISSIAAGSSTTTIAGATTTTNNNSNMYNIQSSTTTNNSNSSSSCSTSDNICANARRRATDIWASKLNTQRTRYNDPNDIATIAENARKAHLNKTTQLRKLSTEMMATTSTASSITSANSSNGRGATNRRNSSGTYGNVNVNSSGANGNGNGNRGRINLDLMRRSPADFQVDDLIEEDHDYDME